MNVQFDGRGSSDPEGGALIYAWDLDGNGVYDNGSTAQVPWLYNSNALYNARLRVTDPQGATSTASAVITAGNTPPVPTITTPSASLKWKVGDAISFSGGATDLQDVTEPASRLDWTLLLHHCSSPTNCHIHTIQDFAGVSSGVFSAPNHSYPAYLELQLSATDSGGLSAMTSVRLDPQTVDLTFLSNPPGLPLTVTAATVVTPFTGTYIVNSQIQVIAPTTAVQSGTTYTFASWSDGGAATHSFSAPASAAVYTALYEAPPTAPGVPVVTATGGTRPGVCRGRCRRMVGRRSRGIGCIGGRVRVGSWRHRWRRWGAMSLPMTTTRW